LIASSCPSSTRSRCTGHINQSLNWSDPANLPVTSKRLKVMECPSNPNLDHLDSDPTTAWNAVVATGDYAGVYGVDPRLVTLGLVDRAGEGAISRTKQLRFAEFTDGNSTTLLLGESSGKPDLWRDGKLLRPAPGTRVTGGGWSRPASEVGLLVGSTADGTTFPGPCALNCTNGQEQTAYPDPFYGVDGTGQFYGSTRAA
jgi:hypothetical protein